MKRFIPCSRVSIFSSKNDRVYSGFCATVSVRDNNSITGIEEISKFGKTEKSAISKLRSVVNLK